MRGKARSLAEQAPPERNRCVDFPSAPSILAVVVGGNLLGILPWTRWLTWVV